MKRRIVFADTGISSRVKIDKIGVDTRLLEELLIPAMHRAIETADVIVIDEVGKLENTTKNIQKTINDALNSTKPILVTIHKKSRNPVLQEIRALEGVRIFDITPINRSLLPYRVMKVITGEDEQ